jgi:CDP-glycerol glycerophosphotransferase (TagB/SpsB family)
VLGKQTRRHAEAIQLIPEERIHSIGAPDYDVLFSAAPNARAEIRVSLGVPPEGELFAFYGMRRSTDELGTLRMIDDIIAELMLSGTKVIYRPHPASEQDRIREFCAQSWKSIVLDPVLMDEGGRGVGPGFKDFSSRAAHLRDIYVAIDGIISAPSTTLLEGMWFGRPALVLAYGDNEHPMGPDVIASFLHARELRDIRGFAWCDDGSRLSISFRELRRLSADPDMAADIEGKFSEFIHLDSLGYPERLARLISAVLETPRAQQCEEVSPATREASRDLCLRDVPGNAC